MTDFCRFLGQKRLILAKYYHLPPFYHHRSNPLFMGILDGVVVEW
jgi:hypothetical protein